MIQPECDLGYGNEIPVGGADRRIQITWTKTRTA